MNEDQEIEACRSLLEEIADMSDHASLTGSLSKGAGRTVQRYNAVLDRLESLDVIPHGLCEPLPDDAGFDEIGVEARMLGSFINRKGKAAKGRRDKSVLTRLAPFVDSRELGDLVREQLRHGLSIDLEDLTQLAPFLDKRMLSD